MLVDVAITIYSMHFFLQKKILGGERARDRDRDREFHYKTNISNSESIKV